MFSRKSLFRASAIALLGAVATVPTGASSQAQHSMYVTFNRPVSLPGLTLRSGTYIFEAPDPDSSHDLVRVLSRDRSIVFLTTFTRTVDRPVSMKSSQVISFREPSRDGTLPIDAWWPKDSVGHQFIYPDR
jgi:hypothetical protein